MIEIEVTYQFIISIIATYGILALFVLKYGEVRTKLLFLIFGLITTGLFILKFSKFWGSILTIIGVLLAVPYVAKALRDIIPQI